MKLTAAAVKAAETRTKEYKLADGRGLHLLVKPNGGKYWRMKYRYGGKEKQLALGVYPEISLAKAREKWCESCCWRDIEFRFSWMDCALTERSDT